MQYDETSRTKEDEMLHTITTAMAILYAVVGVSVVSQLFGGDFEGIGVLEFIMNIGYLIQAVLVMVGLLSKRRVGAKVSICAFIVYWLTDLILTFSFKDALIAKMLVELKNANPNVVIDADVVARSFYMTEIATFVLGLIPMYLLFKFYKTLVATATRSTLESPSKAESAN